MRNCEIVSAEEFLAGITRHIPDKGSQMVRYYTWHSNRARGERAKYEAESGPAEPVDVEGIDVSEYQPPRIPSKKWRELIEKILRHLAPWPEQAEPACLSRAPPSKLPPEGGERIMEPFFEDPFPDYDTEPVMAYASAPDFAARGDCPEVAPGQGSLPSSQRRVLPWPSRSSCRTQPAPPSLAHGLARERAGCPRPAGGRAGLAPRTGFLVCSVRNPGRQVAEHA